MAHWASAWTWSTPNAEDDEDSVSAGFQLKLPTLEELKEYISGTKLPFFLKGALSVQDAVTAKELGAAEIILSHHNGLMRWAAAGDPQGGGNRFHSHR